MHLGRSEALNELQSHKAICSSHAKHPFMSIHNSTEACNHEPLIIIANKHQNISHTHR